MIQIQKQRQKQRAKLSRKKFLLFLGFNFAVTVLMAPFIIFYGPFEALKVMAVGSINTSRHPQVVRAFLSSVQIDTIMHQYDQVGVNTSTKIDTKKVDTGPDSGIEIEDIQGHTFKGKVMLIHEPERVKVAVTNQLGVAGERLTDFVRETGAVAAINAGGFNDPNGKGNGGFPEGLTVHEGKVVYNDPGDQKGNLLIGIDNKGKLIITPLTAEAQAENHIQEAVSFFGPNLIVNGKPVVVGDGGLGIAPRTGIGQTADGTIIFAVIDGRQPTWSWGATARDLMNVFQEYHAVNAVNLDGGSSTEIVYQGKVLNRLWDIFGERYVPNAFVVLPK